MCESIDHNVRDCKYVSMGAILAICGLAMIMNYLKYYYESDTGTEIESEHSWFNSLVHNLFNIPTYSTTRIYT